MENLKELLEIKDNKVNSRDLWKWLESKQKYSDWIKGRIDKYEFVEGDDYNLHKFMKVQIEGEDFNLLKISNNT